MTDTIAKTGRHYFHLDDRTLIYTCTHCGKQAWWPGNLFVAECPSLAAGCSHFWRWSDEVAADTLLAGYECDFCGMTR